MVIDLGTGDGRAVLRRAAASPRSLVIGVDADASSMFEASRRASRGARKGGLPNVLFVPAAAEAIPPELRGRADEVSLLFPWGSLLRGVLGLAGGEAAAGGIASLLSPAGRATAFVSVVPTDRLEGLEVLDATAVERLAAAHAVNGIELVAACPATTEQVHATGSSWARRLRATNGGRPVWRLEFGRRPGRR